MIAAPSIPTTPNMPAQGATLSDIGGVRTRSFVEALREAEGETDASKRADAEARATAQEFVSVALVQPLLAQLREANDAWGPFKPGAHEKQFGAMLDAEYASRITRASGYGLVDRLAQDLRRTIATGSVRTDTSA